MTLGLSACLSVHLLVGPSECLFIFTSASLMMCIKLCWTVHEIQHTRPPPHACACLSACLYVGLPACLPVCLSAVLKRCLVSDHVCVCVCAALQARGQLTGAAQTSLPNCLSACLSVWWNQKTSDV